MLTKYERETIINFNQEDTTATIFTYEARWQTYIEKRLGIQPKEVNSFGGKTYILLKKQIGKPRQLSTYKKVLTLDQRIILRERLQNARQKKGA